MAWNCPPVCIPGKGAAVFASILLFSTIFSSTTLAYEESFLYDGNGNLIQDGRFHYEYNGRNLLKTVRLGNESGRILEEYKYRHDGQRGLKVVYNEDGSNKTTLYLNKEWEVHFNETGAKENIHYVFANGERVAKIYENGSKIYYLNDHLGSSSVLVNDQGEVVDRIKYRPFGAVRKGDNVSDYGYNSKELDDTGLMYYGARYYNPKLRRWTQADTIIQDEYDPQSLNRYTYTRNNPIKFVDPSGNIFKLGEDGNTIYQNGKLYGYIGTEIQYYYGDSVVPAYYEYVGMRMVINEGTITFEPFDFYGELKREPNRDTEMACAKCALDVASYKIKLLKKFTDTLSFISSSTNTLKGDYRGAFMDWLPCGDLMDDFIEKKSMQLTPGEKLEGYNGPVVNIRTNDLRFLLNTIAPPNVVYNENLQPRSQKYPWIPLNTNDLKYEIVDDEDEEN